MLTQQEIEFVREALSAAWQLADIAGDWNLDEVEINGEMVSIYDLQHMFTSAKINLAELEAAPQEWTPLPDGRYELNTPEPSHLVIENHGEYGYQRTEQVFPGMDEVSTFYWTDDIRLCRRTASPAQEG
jgi:hypothetical protein